jgi:2-dehydropantoate 2-reductase
MRIAVMGAGGQGGLFGSLLSQAGNDVTFIARGKNLEAIQTNGLKLKSKVFGDFTVQVNATDNPESVGEVDLILFCVKNYDLDTATEHIKPMIGADTIVLTVQNGVEAPYRLGNAIGSEHVVAGVSGINSHLVAPGEVQHIVGKNFLFGELSGIVSSRVEKLEKAFKEAGFEALASDDIKGELWNKLTWLSTATGVVCLTRSSIGIIRDHEETWELMRRVMLETASVALAEGVVISEDSIDNWLDMFSSAPPNTKPSMMADLEAGRRIELDTLIGSVVRFGRKHGVDTPYNYAIYSALKPYQNGTPTPKAHN